MTGTLVAADSCVRVLPLLTRDPLCRIFEGIKLKQTREKNKCMKERETLKPSWSDVY